MVVVIGGRPQPFRRRNAVWVYKLRLAHAEMEADGPQEHQDELRKNKK